MFGGQNALASKQYLQRIQDFITMENQYSQLHIPHSLEGFWHWQPASTSLPSMKKIKCW